ncbi:unnamed protein product [Brassica oleracea var. botrytis]
MALNASWLPFSLIGRLFLNATLDIHFYFDNDCVASINYLKKVCGFDEGSSSAPTKYNGVKKIESIPPSELNSHVLTASPEMHMTAEFVAFDSENDQAYKCQCHPFKCQGSRRISANERGRPRHPRISTSPKPSISTSPNSTSHQNIRAPQRPASLIATSALLYLILTPTCV